MNLKHELEIPESNPFKNDKVKREEEAKTLTDLVKNYSDGFVLALNNEWGAGKTTFVKMWQAYLKNEGVESLYFNAWENDYQENVLVALLSELKELKKEDEKKFKNVIKKAGPIATSVLAGSITALAKTVGADGIIQAFIDAATEGGEKLLNSEIETYTNRKKGLKDFQNSLKEYAKAVSGENPLVFIIDELDRCRPSYAVELLEQVKHVFSVPGIIFVLAIDKVQLGHAVKGVYGSPGMDDVEYLRRFIDVEFSLPMPSPRYFIDYLFEYFNFNTFLLDENPRSSGNFFADTLKDFILTLSKIFNLQLRQIESLLKHLKIVFSSFRPVGGVNASIYILLAVLKLVHPEIYNRIKHRTFEEQDLINELSKLLPSNLNDKG